MELELDVSAKERKRKEEKSARENPIPLSQHPRRAGGRETREEKTVVADRRTEGPKDRRTEGSRREEEQGEKRADQPTDRPTDGRTDKRTDGQTDRRTDTKTTSSLGGGGGGMTKDGGSGDGRSRSVGGRVTVEHTVVSKYSVSKDGWKTNVLHSRHSAVCVCVLCVTI